MMFGLAALALATYYPTAPAPSGAPRMVVCTSDLNLKTSDGAAKLRHRVDDAVMAMSRDAGQTTGSLFPAPELQAARRAARHQAEAAIAAARSRASLEKHSIVAMR